MSKAMEVKAWSNKARESEERRVMETAAGYSI